MPPSIGMLQVSLAMVSTLGGGRASSFSFVHAHARESVYIFALVVEETGGAQRAHVFAL